MGQYRKLIVAVLVPVVGFGLKWLGVDIEFGEAEANSLLALLIPILTAIGVVAVPNDA